MSYHKIPRRLLPTIARAFSSSFAYHCTYSTPSALALRRGSASSHCARTVLPLRNYRQRFSSAANSSTANSLSPSSSETTSQNANEINIRDRVKLISLGQGIVHVLLSRPSKLNSLDLEMFEAVADAASRLKNDTNFSKDLRAVILSGEGRAFCTGLDAKGVALSGPSKSLNRLLERPSPYGGNDGVGNLAQDVSVLWR